MKKQSYSYSTLPDTHQLAANRAAKEGKSLSSAIDGFLQTYGNGQRTAGDDRQVPGAASNCIEIPNQRA